MLVPTTVEQVVALHGRFYRPPSQQAAGRKRPRSADIGAVHVEHMLRFLRKVSQAGYETPFHVVRSARAFLGPVARLPTRSHVATVDTLPNTSF